MKIVDAKGKLCPVPLIMTKKALMEIGPNEELTVIVDNETSMKNVKRFLEDHQMKITVNERGNTWEIWVNKTGEMEASVQAEAYCTTSPQEDSSYVVAFQRDHMGDGDMELGKTLLKAFINTLPEADRRPETLIFLNAGVFMVTDSSPVLETLRKLEGAGTKIIACGTCLDFYQLKEKLAVGRISNMYEILETLSKTPKVIYP